MATFTIDEAVNGGKKTFSVAEAYGNAAPDSPNPLWDALKSLPSSAARAGAGIVGFPQVLVDLGDRAATKLTNLVGYDQDKSPVFGAIDRFVGDKLGINLKDPAPIQRQLGIQNLGDISLRGNKWLMGPLYHDPQTSLGRVADFTAQNVLSGGTSKRGLLQSAAQGVSGGLLGEAGDTLLGPWGRVAGQIIGILGAGFIPSLRSTPGSVAKDALEGVTDAQLAQAKSLMDDAARMGTPLTVSEAVAQVTGGNPLQQVQRWAEQAPKGRQAFDPMMNARPAANRLAFGNAADQIGTRPSAPELVPINLQQAAQAAEKKITEFRTEAASPYYQGQRASDANALDLLDSIPKQAETVADRFAARDNAIHTTGKLYADTMQQRNLANQSAARSDSYIQGIKTSRHMDRFREGVDATLDARAIASQRLAEAEAAQQQLYQMQDALAAKNLPAIRSQVSGFVSDLDNNIRLAGPTQEGQILRAFRDEIAPNGQPIVLPSQLESIYKANRNKLDLGLDPTDIQKTQAGVLGPYVRNLDNLIKNVSPDISNGRAVYQQVTQDILNPVKNGTVGRLARSMDDATDPVSGLNRQSSILMNPSPLIAPATIRRTAMILKEQNPTAMPDFVRTNLQKIFNEKAQDLVTGEAQGGAAKFAADIAGNSAQKANLQALVESTGGKTAWTGFNRLLEVFQAQGKRMAPGSPTEANRLLTGEMSTKWSGLTDKPLEMWNQWRIRSNSEALGNLLTDQNGIEKLKQLAFTNPNTAKRTLLVGEILGIMNPVDQSNADTTQK